MSNYKDLVTRIITDGFVKTSRAGNVVYKFGESIAFDLEKGFPIITEREVAYNAAFGELSAFIHGCTKVSEFKALGCNYWDAYGEDLGPIYGAQWRNFEGTDQLRSLINNLKADHSSRRHILTTWNPRRLSEMVLPPCHIMAQYDVYNDKLSSIVYMRSADVMLGLPYDIIVYAGLQHLLARELDLNVGTLQFYFGNCHIYRNHIEAAEAISKSTVERPLPFLHNVCDNLLDFRPDDFYVTGYESGPKITIKLNL